jgi:cell division protein FtsA
LGLHGLADSISRPAYATAVGLLQWALTHTSFLIEDEELEEGGMGFVARFGRWLRAFIP